MGASGRPLVDEVTARLRSRIQSGELAAGDRLPPQRLLARDFGIARPTLVHAIRLLEEQGLVETRRGTLGGTFVLDLDRPARRWFETVRMSWSELEDILVFRAAVESEAASRAAVQRTPRHLETLERTQRLISEAVTPAEFRRADALFHATLLRASGSRRLEHAGLQARGELFSPVDRALRPRLVAVTLRDHQAVLEAVKAQDAQAAAAAVRAHIDTTRTELRAATERKFTE